MKKINFERIFQILPNNFGIFDVNYPDFTVLAANPRFIEGTYQLPKDVIGHGLFEAYPANESSATAKDIIISSLKKVIETKKLDKCPTVRYDVPIKGTNEFTPKYWVLTHIPYVENNNVICILQCAIDITPAVDLGFPL